MRKLMVLAAMLAMMLAMASPAFAQATAVDFGDDDESFNTAISNNVLFVDADQRNFGDQNAASVDGDASNSANTFDLSTYQVNSSFNLFW